MSVAVGSIACMAASGFLVAVLWRDSDSVVQQREEERRARAAELRRRHERRQRAVKYRPLN